MIRISNSAHYVGTSFCLFAARELDFIKLATGYIYLIIMSQY